MFACMCGTMVVAGVKFHIAIYTNTFEGKRKETCVEHKLSVNINKNNLPMLFFSL